MLRVTVWGENVHEKKNKLVGDLYPTGMHGCIADALKKGVRELRDGRPFVLDVVAERVGLLADSTWYPKYSIAEKRTKRV